MGIIQKQNTQSREAICRCKLTKSNKNKDRLQLERNATAEDFIIRDKNVVSTRGEDVFGKDRCGLECTKEQQKCMTLLLRVFSGEFSQLAAFSKP